MFVVVLYLVHKSSYKIYFLTSLISPSLFICKRDRNEPGVKARFFLIREQAETRHNCEWRFLDQIE